MPEKSSFEDQLTAQTYESQKPYNLQSIPEEDQPQEDVLQQLSSLKALQQ